MSQSSMTRVKMMVKSFVGFKSAVKVLNATKLKKLVREEKHATRVNNSRYFCMFHQSVVFFASG